MKNLPRQPRSRAKTAIILRVRSSSFRYYFWRLGEAVAGEVAVGGFVVGGVVVDEPLARRGVQAGDAVHEQLAVRGPSPRFRCDVAAAGAPERTGGAG